MMQQQYTTERLSLNALCPDDAAFMLELVNTPGWLQFIGDRNIRTIDHAFAYICGTLKNENILYWVVKLKDCGTPIGIITFIKRDYLEHRDIGFAFLPAHTGKGFAFEATNAVLQDVLQTGNYKQVLATTMRANDCSIKLL